MPRLPRSPAVPRQWLRRRLAGSAFDPPLPGDSVTDSSEEKSEGSWDWERPLPPFPPLTLLLLLLLLLLLCRFLLRYWLRRFCWCAVRGGLGPRRERGAAGDVLQRGSERGTGARARRGRASRPPSCHRHRCLGHSREACQRNSKDTIRPPGFHHLLHPPSHTMHDLVRVPAGSAGSAGSAVTTLRAPGLAMRVARCATLRRALRGRSSWRGRRACVGTGRQPRSAGWQAARSSTCFGTTTQRLGLAAGPRSFRLLW